MLSRLALQPGIALGFGLMLGVWFLLLVAPPGRVNGEGKVKDAIVNVLSSEWPLSLKEIYFAVVRHYSLGVSHQAVYKALKKLVEDKVVVKHERKYCLSIGWIQEVKRFAAGFEEAYIQHQKEALLKEANFLEKHAPAGTYSRFCRNRTQPCVA